MTVSKFIEKYSPTVYNLIGENEISGGYAGDLLSNVMSGINEGALWFTVMSNVNVAAVASLSGCAAVILCGGTKPDKQLLEAAKTKRICLLGSQLDVYSAILEYEILL